MKSLQSRSLPLRHLSLIRLKCIPLKRSQQVFSMYSNSLGTFLSESETEYRERLYALGLDTLIRKCNMIEFLFPGTSPVCRIWSPPLSIHAPAAPLGWPVRYF
jgi:hypothetical protein